MDRRAYLFSHICSRANESGPPQNITSASTAGGLRDAIRPGVERPLSASLRGRDEMAVCGPSLERQSPLMKINEHARRRNYHWRMSPASEYRDGAWGSPDPQRLGGLGWARRTGGRLTSRERSRLLAAIALGQWENVVGRARLALGRLPPAAANVDLDTFVAPDSLFAREAEQACAELPARCAARYRATAIGLSGCGCAETAAATSARTAPTSTTASKPAQARD
jgi:hypothetical protein